MIADTVTHSPTPRRLALSRAFVRAAGVTLAAATAMTGAFARPTHYQCTGYQPMDVDFSPLVAQVRFQDQHYTLKRVRDGGEARFVGGRGVDVTLTMRQSAMELRLKGETLQCKLVSDALAPFTASAPH